MLKLVFFNFYRSCKNRFLLFKIEIFLQRMEALINRNAVFLQFAVTQDYISLREFGYLRRHAAISYLFYKDLGFGNGLILSLYWWGWC